MSFKISAMHCIKTCDSAKHGIKTCKNKDDYIVERHIACKISLSSNHRLVELGILTNDMSSTHHRIDVLTIVEKEMSAQLSTFHPTIRNTIRMQKNIQWKRWILACYMPDKYRIGNENPIGYGAPIRNNRGLPSIGDLLEYSKLHTLENLINDMRNKEYTFAQRRLIKKKLFPFQIRTRLFHK